MIEKLNKLSLHLQRVLKLVLDNERIAAEVRLGHKLAPLDFFNLLTRDESFAWIKPLSSLIAEIDEFSDESKKNLTPVTQKDLESFRKRVEFTLLDPKSSVTERYLQYLSQDTDLVIAHADLRAELSS